MKQFNKLINILLASMAIIGIVVVILSFFNVFDLTDEMILLLLVIFFISSFKFIIIDNKTHGKIKNPFGKSSRS